MESSTDSLLLDKESVPSMERPNSQASSVTLDFTDTQASSVTLDFTDIKARPSFFNPIQPGGPRLRSRPPEAAPDTILRREPRIKLEHDGNAHVWNTAIRETTTTDITNDEQVGEVSQAIVKSNRRPPLSSDDSIEDYELVTRQSGISIGKDASLTESSKVNSTYSAIKQRLERKGPMDIAKVGATQRALLERAKRAAKQENSAQLQINRNNFVQKRIEDNSWMYEAPGLDDEYRKLVDKILTLQEREKNGKITGAESITLRRLNKELLVQKRLKDAATRAKSFEAEEDSLFIPEETKEEAAQRHVRSAPEIFRKESPILSAEDEENVTTEDAELADEMDMNEESTSKKTEPEQTKKPRRKPAKDAREFFHRERQDRQNKERQKGQKKRARNSTKTSGQNGKTKSNKATKQGKANLKVNKDMKNMLNDMGVKAVDGKDDIAQMFLDELTSGDQIVDRLTNPFFNTAPGKKIFARRKDTQLQRLLANIPDGSNTKSATTDKEKLRRASMSFGYKMVEAVNGMWLVKGMKSSLHHHQLLGAQWMLSREFGSGEPPFGGLLADAMGLGKTVQTLACMVGNMPQDDDRKRGRGATLIVAPSSVINQWMDEIYVHAKESVFPRIHHYTSSSKMSKAIIESLDIVVTSYTEVMRQIPWPQDKEGHKLLKGIGFEKWLQEFGGQVGVLHQISWYRVVLDEAHAIKNDSARTSKACQNLKSLYKWCLTGTPLMNRLEETYPYLRFLGADYEMDWDTFQEKFCDPEADESYARLAVIISNTMLRRTMKTSILNRPIITLPKPHPEVRYVDFSPQEEILYRITEKRYRIKIEQYFELCTTKKNYRHIFVFLLRLRQCTSHPFLLEKIIKEYWRSEDVEELKDGLSKLSNDHAPFYEQCAAWVKQSEKERQALEEAREKGEPVPDAPESMPFGASDFGHQFTMDKALAALREDEIMCSICGYFPYQPTKTDCGHIFCQECLEDNMHKAAAADDFQYFVCPHCDKVFTEATPYEGMQFDDEEDDADSVNEDDAFAQSQGPGRSRTKRKSKNGPGTDEMGFEPTSASSTWLKMSDHDPDAKLVPSTKVTFVKSILLKGFEEAPMDKVVIYVQFRLVARIIGRMCKKEGWKFVYLTGDTSLDHRTDAIKMFRERDDVNILISGLRCGGLGLNFPFANRCISLDLWWNHAVEQQAFGRIFRLGQQKETYMTRVAVRNTIDMRFLSVQLYKMRNCEKAMQERGKLGIAELVKLFGFLKTDEDDNIIGVGPDYVDEGGDDTVQDADDPIPGKHMGGEGVHVDGDWSFGDTTIPLGDESENIASTTGSGAGSGSGSCSGSGSGSGVEAVSNSTSGTAKEVPSGHFAASAATGSGGSRDDPMEID